MPLTPEQALAHLDEVAAKYHGTRQDHQILAQSIAVLRDALIELRSLRELIATPAEPPAPRILRPGVAGDTDGSYG